MDIPLITSVIILFGMFIIPGLLWSYGLFPQRGGLSSFERLSFAFLFSLALPSLVIILLNRFGMQLTRGNLAMLSVAVALVGGVVFLLRRRTHPRQQKLQRVPHIMHGGQK